MWHCSMTSGTLYPRAAAVARPHCGGVGVGVGVVPSVVCVARLASKSGSVCNCATRTGAAKAIGGQHMYLRQIVSLVAQSHATSGDEWR
jgi:hypothetical protein